MTRKKLGLVGWLNNVNNVQEAWNDLENKLVNVVDTLVPISDFKGNHLALKLPTNWLQFDTPTVSYLVDIVHV